MYVYMYMYVHIYMCVYIYICTHTYTYVIHIHTYLFLYPYIYIHICIYVCIHIYRYVHTSTNGLKRSYSICKAQQSVRFPHDNLVTLSFEICDFSKLFWNSDYCQIFPLKSTDIWRYRIQPFCILSFHLQFWALSTPPVGTCVVITHLTSKGGGVEQEGVRDTREEVREMCGEGLYWARWTLSFKIGEHWQHLRT